jgi:hypothetical protein
LVLIIFAVHYSGALFKCSDHFLRNLVEEEVYSRSVKWRAETKINGEIDPRLVGARPWSKPPLIDQVFEKPARRRCCPHSSLGIKSYERYVLFVEEPETDPEFSLEQTIPMSPNHARPCAPRDKLLITLNICHNAIKLVRGERHELAFLERTGQRRSRGLL